MNLDDEDKGMCLACIGTGTIYDGIQEEMHPCPHCEATGEATDAENECYLSLNNQFI